MRILPLTSTEPEFYPWVLFPSMLLTCCMTLNKILFCTAALRSDLSYQSTQLKLSAKLSKSLVSVVALTDAILSRLALFRMLPQRSISEPVALTMSWLSLSPSTASASLSHRTHAAWFHLQSPSWPIPALPIMSRSLLSC